MNRGLVLSLCAAVAASAMATASFADVDVALNLRYTHPNDPTQGGTWELVAKTDNTEGIVGVSAYLADAEGASASAGAGVNHDILSGIAPAATTPDGALNVVYGQNLAASPLAGVGISEALVGDDQFNNPDWDASSILVTGGTFGGTRPTFTSSTSNGITNETDANEWDGANGIGVAAGNVTTVVRGDSVGDDGLLLGDRDRDGAVNTVADLLPILPNIGMNITGWENGDFVVSALGAVNVVEDILPMLPNIGQTRVPPAVAAVGAVPEPSTVALLITFAAGLGIAGRRRMR